MTHPLITEELIQKAEYAFSAEHVSTHRMRDALTAILPDIVEQCANVADKWARAAGEDEFIGTAELIAIAIRSLAPKDEKTGS